MPDFTFLQLIAILAYIALLGYTVRSVLKSKVLIEKRVQHLLFGTSASLFVLWMFRTGIYEGLNVHFLWLTASMLVLGLRLSILSSALALLGLTILTREPIEMFGVNGLLGTVAPLAFSYLVYNLSFHRLPRNFPVYIFVCAFFTGAIVLTLKMGLMGGYYYLDGTHDWLTIEGNYLVLIPLLLFPEGLLNGMTMTLLVIYKPQWVYTFYDKYYLWNK